MTTKKEPTFRLNLSLIEELITEAYTSAVDTDNAHLARIAGKIEGIIEGTICPVPQHFGISKDDRQLLDELDRQLKEEETTKTKGDN
tara:strand:- start:987 stop:1247 length:261 start_codon:yes stop_codon:yes gene_type:complete